jgi:hypothetical protein
LPVLESGLLESGLLESGAVAGEVVDGGVSVLMMDYGTEEVDC